MIAKMLIFYEVIQFIPNIVHGLENSEPEPGSKTLSLDLNPGARVSSSRV